MAVPIGRGQPRQLWPGGVVQGVVDRAGQARQAPVHTAGPVAEPFPGQHRDVLQQTRPLLGAGVRARLERRQPRHRLHRDHLTTPIRPRASRAAHRALPRPARARMRVLAQLLNRRKPQPARPTHRPGQGGVDDQNAELDGHERSRRARSGQTRTSAPRQGSRGLTARGVSATRRLAPGVRGRGPGPWRGTRTHARGHPAPHR